MASSTASRVLTVYDVMDAMRALAAIAVLMSHARNVLFLDATAALSILWKLFYFVTGFGHEAVMIFFVLSGYWITRTVSRRSADGGFAYSDYLIDRLSRLWIVLIPALLLGGGLDSIGRYLTSGPLYLGLQGTNSLTWDVATRMTAIDLAGNLLFLQTLLVEPFGSNAPLWSLANEFWYYVWFPPLFLMARQRRMSMLSGLVVFGTMVAFRQLLPGFLCWLVGSVLHFSTQGRASDRLRRHPNIVVGMAVMVFLAALCLSRLHLAIDPRIMDLTVSGAFASLLFALIQCGKTYPGFLAPLGRFGAGSSYSLYVTHFPLILLLAAVLSQSEDRLPPSAGLLLIFVGIGVVCVGYGYALSAFTEAHTAHFRRWLKGRYARLT